MDQIGVGECQTHQVLWWDARIRKCVKDVEDNGGRLEPHHIHPAILSSIREGKVSGLYLDQHSGLVFRRIPGGATQYEQQQQQQQQQHYQQQQQQQQQQQPPRPLSSQAPAFTHNPHAGMAGVGRGGGSYARGPRPPMTGYGARPPLATPDAAGAYMSTAGTLGGGSGRGRGGVTGVGGVPGQAAVFPNDDIAMGGVAAGRGAPRRPSPQEAAFHAYGRGVGGRGAGAPVLPDPPSMAPGNQHTAAGRDFTPTATYVRTRQAHQHGLYQQDQMAGQVQHAQHGQYAQQGQPGAWFNDGSTLAPTMTDTASRVNQVLSQRAASATMNHLSDPWTPQLPANSQDVPFSENASPFENPVIQQPNTPPLVAQVRQTFEEDVAGQDRSVGNAKHRLPQGGESSARLAPVAAVPASPGAVGGVDAAAHEQQERSTTQNPSGNASISRNDALPATTAVTGLQTAAPSAHGDVQRRRRVDAQEHEPAEVGVKDVEPSSLKQQQQQLQQEDQQQQEQSASGLPAAGTSLGAPPATVTAVAGPPQSGKAGRVSGSRERQQALEPTQAVGRKSALPTARPGAQGKVPVGVGTNAEATSVRKGATGGATAKQASASSHAEKSATGRAMLPIFRKSTKPYGYKERGAYVEHERGPADGTVPHTSTTAVGEQADDQDLSSSPGAAVGMAAAAGADHEGGGGDGGGGRDHAGDVGAAAPGGDGSGEGEQAAGGSGSGGTITLDTSAAAFTPHEFDSAPAGDHSAACGDAGKKAVSPRTQLFQAAKASVDADAAPRCKAPAQPSALFEAVRAATANDAAVSGVARQSRSDSPARSASRPIVAAPAPPSAAASALYEAVRAAATATATATSASAAQEYAGTPAQAPAKGRASTAARGGSARLQAWVEPYLSTALITSAPPTPAPAHPAAAAKQDENQATGAIRTASSTATAASTARSAAAPAVVPSAERIVPAPAISSRSATGAAPAPAPPSSSSSSLSATRTRSAALGSFVPVTAPAMASTSGDGPAPVHGSASGAPTAAAAAGRSRVADDSAGLETTPRLVVVHDEPSMTSAVSGLGVEACDSSAGVSGGRLTKAYILKGVVAVRLDGTDLGAEDGVISTIELFYSKVVGGAVPTVLVFDVKSLLGTQTGRNILEIDVRSVFEDKIIPKVMHNVHDHAGALARLLQGEGGTPPRIDSLMDLELACEWLDGNAVPKMPFELSDPPPRELSVDGEVIAHGQLDPDVLQLAKNEAVRLVQSCGVAWLALIEDGQLLNVLRASQMKADFALSLKQNGWRRMTFVAADGEMGERGGKRLASYELQKAKELSEKQSGSDNDGHGRGATPSAASTVPRAKSSAAGVRSEAKLDPTGKGIEESIVVASDESPSSTPRYNPPKSGALPPSSLSSSLSSSLLGRRTTSPLRNTGGDEAGLADLRSPGGAGGARNGEGEDAPGHGVEEAKMAVGNLGSGSCSPRGGGGGGGGGGLTRSEGSGGGDAVGNGGGPPSLRAGVTYTDTPLDPDDRRQELPSPGSTTASNKRHGSPRNSSSSITSGRGGNGSKPEDHQTPQNHEQRQRRDVDGDADVLEMLKYLPKLFFQDLLAHSDVISGLEEIVLDQGARPRAFVKGRGKVYMCKDPDVVVTRYHLSCVVGELEHRGLLRADNTAGFDGLLHRVGVMRDKGGTIYGATIRVRRFNHGVADMIDDLLFNPRATSGGRKSWAPSILVLGGHGVGKTSLVRDMCRKLSALESVVIVDTRNDIGGDGVIPHRRAIGQESRRVMVPRETDQNEVILQAYRNHNPRTLVVDEISSQLDVEACLQIKTRGVRVVAGAVGDLPSVLDSEKLGAALGGLEDVASSDRGEDEDESTSSDGTAKERRAGQPVFDAIVELEVRGEGGQPLWTIVTDVEGVVDELLASGAVSRPEMRMPLGDNEPDEEETGGRNGDDGFADRSHRCKPFLRKIVRDQSSRWLW
ncbi:unnamed protein product [Pylaiella littoralis]